MWTLNLMMQPIQIDSIPKIVKLINKKTLFKTLGTIVIAHSFSAVQSLYCVNKDKRDEK